MRSEDKIQAIFLADIHLSLNPPIWRSVEPDWFAAMKRPLDEVKALAAKHQCPIIAAGDIFHKWNSPPELINFALDNLPEMYAIPGQHDLPLHNYDDIERSAYWTLVKAGKIVTISADVLVSISSLNLTLYGFPYGNKISPCGYDDGEENMSLQIAVIHEYVWIDGKSYPDAPAQYNLGRRRTKFKNGKILGYDVMVYGDNHIGFSGIGVSLNTQTEIFNCGSLMRRNSDQKDYQPQVGLLMDSGRIVPYYLDISKDKFLKIQNIKLSGQILDMQGFIEELEKLGDTDLDFSKTMEQYLTKHKVHKKIWDVILKAMNDE